MKSRRREDGDLLPDVQTWTLEFGEFRTFQPGVDRLAFREKSAPSGPRAPEKFPDGNFRFLSDQIVVLEYAHQVLTIDHEVYQPIQGPVAVERAKPDFFRGQQTEENVTTDPTFQPRRVRR